MSTTDPPSEAPSHIEGQEALRREISELKQALAERDQVVSGLRREIERLQEIEGEQQKLIAAVESSSDFIGMATVDGRVFYVNEAGRRMMGFDSVEDAARTVIADYFTPEDRDYALQHIMPDIMGEKGRWQGNFRFRHQKTHAVIPVHYSIFAIKDLTTGEVIAIGTVTRDITERTQAEEERARLNDELIRMQAAALEELSTPLIPITDDLIVTPLIGSVDARRAQRVMETLMRGVTEHRAKTVILDITGVSMIDSGVADALLRAARAVGLLGARTVLTGMSPQMAQTFVGLGIDFEGIVTRGTLQSGIAWATAEDRRRGTPQEQRPATRRS